MLTILAYLAQFAAFVAMIAFGGHRKLPHLFWCVMIQAAIFVVYPALPHGSYGAYFFWHNSNVLNILLNFMLYAVYGMRNGPVFYVALCNAANAALKLALYSGIDADTQVDTAGLLQLVHAIVSILGDVLTAYAGYSVWVSNPHEEQECSIL